MNTLRIWLGLAIVALGNLVDVTHLGNPAEPVWRVGEAILPREFADGAYFAWMERWSGARRETV